MQTEHKPIPFTDQASVRKWESKIAPYTFKKYAIVLKKLCLRLNKSPDEILEEFRDNDSKYRLIDEILLPWLNEMAVTLHYKQYLIKVIYSFFYHNRNPLPKEKIVVREGRETCGHLMTIEEFQRIVRAMKPKQRRMVLIILYTISDADGFNYINRRCWPEISRQLDNNIIKIDFPHGRKLNKNPFFKLLGGQGLEALRKHIKKEPVTKNIIFMGREGPYNAQSLQENFRKTATRLKLTGKRESLRTGFSIHRLRHLARSLFTETGGALTCEFAMGHKLDRYGYDQIYNLKPQLVEEEYRKALPKFDQLFEGMKL